jgi:Family of unknown function (DUF6353)
MSQMDMKAVSSKASGKLDFFVRKNGPAILTATGVAGFVLTNVLTARASMRAKPKLEKLREDREKIQSKQIDALYTVKDQARELSTLYLSDGMAIVKEFTPAISMGVVSIFCVVSSHKMMADKQAALMAAYTAVDRGFKAYRRRIEEELGKEKELELYRGVKVIERKEGDEGFDPNVPCAIDYDDRRASPYSRFFDSDSVQWSKTPEYNMFFLKAQEDWANDRLRSHGFVFLNEVYESLGFKRSQAGQIVGWKLEGDGDGFVSFGLDSIGDDSSRAFTNGVEHTVLLDFNVDGPITI